MEIWTYGHGLQGYSVMDILLYLYVV